MKSNSCLMMFLSTITVIVLSTLASVYAQENMTDSTGTKFFAIQHA